MSILIKTMTNLPEHCYDCPCHDGESGYCKADKEHRYSDYRPFWCPLQELCIDNIKAEIKGLIEEYDARCDRWKPSLYESNKWGERAEGLERALKIIDKHINDKESEEQA